MKLIKSLFAIAFFFAINTVSAQSVASKWPQLNDFQELLVKTFEPAGEGNFGRGLGARSHSGPAAGRQRERDHGEP